MESQVDYRFYAVVFEDEGTNHEQRSRWPLEIRKGKEMNSPLKSPGKYSDFT